MVKLNSFKVDSHLMDTGDWISPGEEYGDLSIRTRGLNDRYYDARAAKMRRSAMIYGGDQTKIPTAINRRILADCLTEHVILDVKNISDETGKPIEYETFCKLLYDPDYADLLIACIRAASQVGIAKHDDMEIASKNSPPASSKP